MENVQLQKSKQHSTIECNRNTTHAIRVAPSTMPTKSTICHNDNIVTRLYLPVGFCSINDNDTKFNPYSWIKKKQLYENSSFEIYICIMYMLFIKLTQTNWYRVAGGFVAVASFVYSPFKMCTGLDTAFSLFHSFMKLSIRNCFCDCCFVSMILRPEEGDKKQQRRWRPTKSISIYMIFMLCENSTKYLAKWKCFHCCIR